MAVARGASISSEQRSARARDKGPRSKKTLRERASKSPTPATSTRLGKSMLRAQCGVEGGEASRRSAIGSIVSFDAADAASVTKPARRHRKAVWLWTLLSFVLVLVAMEPYSAWVHRVVWHGPLWSMHRSHHRERLGAPAPCGLVANDVLSASHVPFSMALIAWGVFTDGVAASLALGAGLGMGAFGLLYLVVHDGMVHGRLPVVALARHGIFAAITSAHQRHHGTNGAPYGLFAAPFLTDAPRAADPQDTEATLPARSRPSRRSAPGDTPMKRLKARLKAASD